MKDAVRGGDEEDEAILNYGIEKFNSGHQALIYGDYYFMDAIFKIKNMYK